MEKQESLNHAGFRDLSYVSCLRCKILDACQSNYTYCPTGTPENVESSPPCSHVETEVINCLRFEMTTHEKELLEYCIGHYSKKESSKRIIDFINDKLEIIQDVINREILKKNK